ncbi:plasmid mobilization relaxosome protein MobC [Sphingomonas sp. PAMC 26605]|uniref:plasmid mobilization relaxosome protein MobC n=1 Tax=Sphingomonas sp. PAMC 26605 TaxID=1112214 RepID=UPI000496EC09|nr:plasmid mobilization relaxosome protein MobC [Sphingomonas sp. PAMC 26605]
MALFTLRLSDELAARFDAVAARAGGRSHALRTLIERVSGGGGEEPSAPPTMRSRGKHRIELRLDDDELAQLDDSAAERGVKRTDWVAAVVRSRLRAAPPPIEARQTLVDIRRELRAIGRNVNQAVHALHSANMQESRLDLAREAARVEAMRAEIDAQVAAIGAAIKGDLAYWRAE